MAEIPEFYADQLIFSVYRRSHDNHREHEELGPARNHITLKTILNVNNLVTIHQTECISNLRQNWEIAVV